ncbi:RHS repeat-associated core domain-containing protein [Nocardioides sp.]|uniref:RHS repeat-associated core domain-containing protein n=1 Tax=Nocardioides sp. TaxID=35761 RepID=UPI0019C4E72C|nr:RHS repeat-associated core domain-containing protein [Nocardioides sp.]MBC7274912.1 hypothetical protein [Nocardioides sp.]
MTSTAEWPRSTSPTPCSSGTPTTGSTAPPANSATTPRAPLTKTQTFDPFDRTTTQTTAITGKPTKSLRFTYLGTSDQVAVDEEKNTLGAWDVAKTYAYGPDGSKLQLTDTPVNGTSNKTQYYGTNPHGDVETLTGTDGTTASTYRYTAYGLPDKKGTTGEDAYSTASSETDRLAADTEVVNPYRFSGKRIHGGFGTYDIGFRDYNPGINRYLTRDHYNGALDDLALGTDPWGANRYAYAGGNPVGMIDLDGHRPIDANGNERPDLDSRVNQPSASGADDDGGSGGTKYGCDNQPTAPGCMNYGDPVELSGDNGDVVGGAANAAIEVTELTPFAGLYNVLGITDYARNTVNDTLDVDTTSDKYFAGEVLFAMITLFAGGGAGGTKAIATGTSKLTRTGAATSTGPSAQEIIQGTARVQAGRGEEALKGSLSAAERAAMEAEPSLTARMLGQAVHRNTAEALEQAYPGRFIYRTRGPDFVDTTTGEMLELTTPGQVGSHLARPGYADVTICTYVLPTC